MALSSLALLRNWRSSRWEKQSADAAVQNAKEAALANQISLRKLGLSDTGHDALNALNDQASPPDVAWRIEKGEGALYVLRNIGTDAAENVRVDESRAPRINRFLPQGLIIQPNVGHTMLLKGSWQHPMPNELYLRWSGHDDWVAEPLPS